MKGKGEHLKLEHRQIIYSMQKSGKEIPEICKIIGCPYSTISRELERKKPDSRVWGPMTGIERAKWMNDQAVSLRTVWRKGPRTALKRWEVQGKVYEAIVVGKRSAEQTALILKQSDELKLSGQTIRRFAAEDKTLKKEFPQKGRQRKPKSKEQTSNGMLPLEARPQACNARERYGDHEIDLIVCSQSTHSILTVRERRSRYIWARRIENRKADTVRKALFQIFQEIPPPLALTATYDRGKEFSDLQSFSRAFKIENYVCGAYRSWEKGAVENANREIRKFFPKGTNLALVTQEELDKALKWINVTPMPVLSGSSPHDDWFLACKKVKEMLN
jgi:IS30 family transposase